MFKQTKNFVRIMMLVSILLFTSCESGKEKGKQHLDAAIELIAQSNLEAAMSELNEAIKYDSDNAEAWYYRGNTHYNLYEVEKAIADYSKAIEINPEHVDAYANRGNARVYNGDTDGGCADWKKAQSLGKKHLEHKMRFCK